MSSNVWELQKIGEIALINMGQSPESKYYNDERIGFPFLQGNRTFGFKYPSYDTFCSSGNKFADPNDILISVRAPVGDLNITREKTCIGRGLASIKMKNGNYEYLFYLLKANIQELINRESGTVFGSINKDDIYNLEVIIAQSDYDQRRIAEILSALDDKIELNRQTNATLEAIAQAIFKEWFVENEKAYEWDLAPLPEVIEINPPRSLKVNQIVPYLDMASMPTTGHRVNGWINRPFGSGTKFINGDTLIAKITPCLENGKTAYVDFLDNGQIGWGSTEYIIFRPKPPIPPEYGYFLARSDEIRNYAIQNMIGTSGRQRVPVNCFNFLSIRIPPTDLVIQFGIIAESLMKQIKANSEESKTLAFIRDALLTKLMSGEIEL